MIPDPDEGQQPSAEWEAGYEQGRLAARAEALAELRRGVEGRIAEYRRVWVASPPLADGEDVWLASHIDALGAAVLALLEPK